MTHFLNDIASGPRIIIVTGHFGSGKTEFSVSLAYALAALRDNGAQWDIIGMSVYPYWARNKGYQNAAMRLIMEAVHNVNLLAKKYGTDVIVTETGF